MSIKIDDFIHPSDKKALDALKAIPGFDIVLKKFMGIVGEKMFQIQTTSSYLKLGVDQLPEIYSILVKVCNKLQIEVPELYLALDRSPNAYTVGDTDVFIVLHSGLLETMTLDQIETVIAHECGHIMCHHVLYHTMGQYLLIAADLLVNGIISRTVVTSMQYAFFYWMRCSEFSADRVAAYYHSSPDPVVDIMLALSGGTSNLHYKFNKDAFLRQAHNYKMLIDNSTYNKVLEFIKFGQIDHPLNACRAYEICEFYKKYATKLLPPKDRASKSGSESKCEYNLRIRYEFIKPKSILKIGNIFNNNRLEIKIDKNKYYIDKNDMKDIRLNSGKHTLYISNSIKKTKYTLDLMYDMNIVVSWDSNSEKIIVREEM